MSRVKFSPMWKSFDMPTRLGLIGLEFKNFDDVYWYDTVTGYAKNLNPNERGAGIYPVEALVKSMNEITDPDDSKKLVASGFLFRKGALVEIWGYMKKFSEAMDPEELKKSILVQNFIEKGYADVYRHNDVPETEFNDFAAKYISPETEEKQRLIKQAIDALSMADTVKIVGIDDPTYNAWPGWHDYLVKTIKQYISDYGDNQNQMLGYLNYQVEGLASDSSRNPEEIGARPNGFFEMWSVVKMFAESIKDVKLIQGSDKVQKFIETGLKTPYNGVPQAEFTEFATKYKKKGWFGGVGRKSRKQNKSRKQGKSRKQRKSRK